MLNFRKYALSVLVIASIFATSITSFAATQNKSTGNSNDLNITSTATLSPSPTPLPERVIGKDEKSGTSIIGNQEDISKDIIINSVIIEEIPIGDTEYSEVLLDPDDWWNPLDGGNQIRGYSYQSIWAIDPYQAGDIPLSKVRHSIKNQLWISGSLVKTSPTNSNYGLVSDVSTPWATDRQVGETCIVQGSHSVFDETLGVPGRQIISRSTEAVGTIPNP